MEKANRLRRQLERLLAQDLSEMGHQAQIRHQERIDELRDLCTPTSDAGRTAAPEESPHLASRGPDQS